MKTTRPRAKLFVPALFLILAASCGDKNAQLGMPLGNAPTGGGGQGGTAKVSSLGTGGLSGTAGSTDLLSSAGSTGTGGQGAGLLDAGSASDTGVDAGKGDAAGGGQVFGDAKGDEAAAGGIVVGGASGSGGVGGTGGTGGSNTGIGGRDGGAGTTGYAEVGVGKDTGGEADARIGDAAIADTSIVDASVVDASIVDGDSIDGDVADGTDANIADVSILDASTVDGNIMDGSDASPGICNDIPNGGAVVPIQFVFAPLSTGATGGATPPNGFYNLTKAIRYQSLDAGLPTVTSVSGTLYLYGTTLMSVIQSGSSSRRTMGDSTSFSGTTMCGNTSCPSPGGFGCSGYTSVSNAFDQFVDMGNGMVQVNTWTLQP